MAHVAIARPGHRGRAAERDPFYVEQLLSMTGSRVRCRRGGFAPCLDDSSHGVDRTLCGLELGFGFCEHDYDPDTCPECNDEYDDDDQFGEVYP